MYIYYLNFAHPDSMEGPEFYALLDGKAVPLDWSERVRDAEYVTMGLSEDLEVDTHYDINITKLYDLRVSLKHLYELSGEEANDKVKMLEALQILHERLLSHAQEKQ